jgi:type IV secretory pathway VirB4 component
MAETTQLAPNSTQQFVDVEEVKDGVVKLRGGGLRAVIIVSGINFELKSEEEQNIITAGYQDFLNSLDFSFQVVIHSRKINVDGYLEKMRQKREQEESELLRNQIDEYVEYIKSFVKENEIMTKAFFVVVPYEGGGTQKLTKGVMGIFSRKSKNAKKEKEESYEQQLNQLRQRIDQILSGLERMGLRAVVLNDEELTELYYNLYNPESVKRELAKEVPKK